MIKSEDKTRNYRTKRTAGRVDSIPDRIPIITNAVYMNALTFNQNSAVHLLLLSISKEEREIKDKRLFLNGVEVRGAQISKYYTQEGIEKINTILLRMFFGVILERFKKREIHSLTDIFTVYYPDLAKKMGKSEHISKNDIEECKKQIASLESVIGIMNHGQNRTNYFEVLICKGYDASKNTISFVSPYMVNIIQYIHEASIRRDRKGNPILKKNGEPQLQAAYSYMIKSSIAKERNRRAVEIVFIVVVLIERAGRDVSHIKARTIIDRNQQLKKSINSCKTQGNANIILYRTFIKAWELLSTQTYLKEYYKNIKLPDIGAKDFKVNWIPTSSTLDMVFDFQHNGKKRKSSISENCSTDFGDM